MGFRLRKLGRMANEEGVAAAMGFLSRDVYFRALQLLAFPLHRASGDSTAYSGNRDLYSEFVKDMRSRPAPKVLELGAL